MALKVAGLRDSGIAFGAKKIFHYDEEKRKGYMTEKSYARGWKDFCDYLKMTKKIRKNHDVMMQQWAEAEKRDHEPWILGEVSGVVTIVCIYFFD